MPKKLKNYRLSENTINQLEAMQNESGKTATEIIENSIQYLYEEYGAALQGVSDKELMLRQILGKRIRRVS